MNTQKYYRYDSYTVGIGYDPDTETFAGRRVEVRLGEFDVTKVTPKGVVLSVYGERKFVLNSAVKQYACSTVELAKASFIARKNKQISILSRRISDANEALRLIDEPARIPMIKTDAYLRPKLDVPEFHVASTGAPT